MLLPWLLRSRTGSYSSRGAAQGSWLLRSRRGVAPQELEQGSWLPGSLRGLAPHEPEPGRLLPGVTIYHHPFGLYHPCILPSGLTHAWSI